VLDVLLWSAILWCVIDFVEHLKKEWSTIRQAPLTMLVVFVLGGLAVWFLRDNTIAGHRAAKESAEATVKLLQAKNDDLKDKVGTDVPSEIKKRIDGLEAQQARMRPRRLNEETIRRLFGLLSRTPGEVVVTHYTSVPDSKAYGDDFIRAFSDAGWKVRLFKSDEAQDSPPSGIGVAVSDPSSLTMRQTILMNALRTVGILFDLQSLSEQDLRDFRMMVNAESPDAEIRISNPSI
jgi:hypothetical protein